MDPPPDNEPLKLRILWLTPKAELPGSLLWSPGTKRLKANGPYGLFKDTEKEPASFLCQIPHRCWKLAKKIKSLPRTLQQERKKKDLSGGGWSKTNSETSVWENVQMPKKSFFSEERWLGILPILDLKEKQWSLWSTFWLLYTSPPPCL